MEKYKIVLKDVPLVLYIWNPIKKDTDKDSGVVTETEKII